MYWLICASNCAFALIQIDSSNSMNEHFVKLKECISINNASLKIDVSFGLTEEQEPAMSYNR